MSGPMPWVKGCGDGCMRLFGPMDERVKGMGACKYWGPWVKWVRDGCLCLGHGRRECGDGCMRVFGPIHSFELIPKDL